MTYCVDLAKSYVPQSDILMIVIWIRTFATTALQSCYVGGRIVMSHYCCNSLTWVSSLRVILLGFGKKLLPVLCLTLLTSGDPLYGAHTGILPFFQESSQRGRQVESFYPRPKLKTASTCASNECPELTETQTSLAQLPTFIIFGVPRPEGELK